MLHFSDFYYIDKTISPEKSQAKDNGQHHTPLTQRNDQTMESVQSEASSALQQQQRMSFLCAAIAKMTNYYNLFVLQ